MPRSVSPVPRPQYVTLEVSVTSAEDAHIASVAGADRLELCSALELGGLTPSPATFLEVRAAVQTPVYVLLRPRPGGFVYTPREWATIRRDAEWFLGHGADGVVCGALTEGAQLNPDRCRELVKAADGKAVLHRAFDFLPDIPDGLRVAIDLGFERVLTSGGKASAPEGQDQIKLLVQRAGGRIGVMAGGGIKSANVARLVRATRCDQVHASLRFSVPETMANSVVAPAMGTTTYTATAEVAAVRAELDRLAAG
jgi:copper homeostasis protein